jgi:hypothetical protein
VSGWGQSEKPFVWLTAHLSSTKMNNSFFVEGFLIIKTTYKNRVKENSQETWITLLQWLEQLEITISQQLQENFTIGMWTPLSSLRYKKKTKIFSRG